LTTQRHSCGGKNPEAATLPVFEHMLNVSEKKSATAARQYLKLFDPVPCFQLILFL
jgi:hypothetical protein